MMSTISRDELHTFTEQFLSDLVEKKRAQAVVVALVGDLGAGKTTFVQTFAEMMGVSEHVTSPTFVLEQVYDLGDNQPFSRLIHIDAYRLESGDDLRRLGWDDTVGDSGNLILVEWADKVKEVIPSDAVWLQLSGSGENEREINAVGEDT